MQMNDPTVEPVLSLDGFLSFLYGGFDEGYIYAPTLNRETGEFVPVFFGIKRLERLARYIRESSADTDVYLSPAIYESPVPKKENILASNVVWCEFDGNSPKAFDTEPSLIIRSSLEGHTHSYWRLDEPLNNAKDIEDVNRALAYTLNADKSGWDANQILRPPESHNFKRDLPVYVQEVSGAIYNVGAFSTYKAPERLDENSIQFGAIPDVMDVIFKYALGKEFQDVFTSTPAEGSRSTYYMRTGYLGAEAGCSNEELFALLSNFDARVGKYSKREDRVTRLIDIIERVRLKIPESSDTDGSLEEVHEHYNIFSFGDLDIKLNWLIPNFLQDQGALLIVGPPGVGKTQLSLNFAYGLASGTETLGLSAGDPRRVLFVSCEMGAVDLKYFTDQMTPRYMEHEELLRENFLIAPRGEPWYINSQKGQDELCRLTESLKLDGIVFDSLGAATPKSLSDDEATKGLLDFLDRYRKNMGVFTWFIHHNRKASENNKEPSGLADVYGSMYITAKSTTVISLWPSKHGLLKVRELKKRLAPEAPDWYIKRTPTALGFTKASDSEAATVVTTKLGKAAGNDKPSNPYGI